MSHHVGIDIDREQLLPLSEAAKLIPSAKGKHLHPASVWRWVRKGVVAPDGRRVKLDSAKVGGRWYTSREAVQRFLEALTQQFEVSAAPSPPRTSGQRQRASDRAAERLDKAGI